MYEVMLVVSVIVYLVVLATALSRATISIFHPLSFYLMFHGLVFVVRPLFAWYYGFDRLYDAIRFHPTVADKITVLVCTNLALIVFSAVSMAIAHRPMSFASSAKAYDRRSELLKNFWPIALVIGLLGTWALISSLQFHATGNIDEIRKVDARTGAGYLEGASGYFISMPLMLSSLTAILAYLGRFKLWSFLPFIAFVLLKLGSGGRGPAVAAAVMIILFYLYENHRRWPGAALLAACAAAYLLFQQVGADRGAGIREGLGLSSSSEQYIRDLSRDKPLESMDLANMEFFEYLVWAVPKRTGGYEYFVHNLQILTEPIPRALWPGKPIGPPILMVELYRYAVPLGATGSVPGAGWLAMGYAGVIIWTALFALIYGGAYRAFVQSRGGTISVVAYVVFIATSTLAYRDGAIITILKQLQFFFVPVIALAVVSRYTKPRPINDFHSADAQSGTLLPPAGRARRQALLESGGGLVAHSTLAPVADGDYDTPKARRARRSASL